MRLKPTLSMIMFTTRMCETLCDREENNPT